MNDHHFRDDVVVGIDVGGEVKGFHAVALKRGSFVDRISNTDPRAIANWCIGQKATVVAVDAPSGWSKDGGSREAERTLSIRGQVIQSFKTPTRERALESPSGFYGWVFNGEKLYERLTTYFPLFDGSLHKGAVCIETFPHAIVCALSDRVLPARPKVARRRKALRKAGVREDVLPNIDFVDAALCAICADTFLISAWQKFGIAGEGFIILPKTTS